MKTTGDKIFKLIVIGGSAGSIPVVRNILSSLPDGFRIPVVVCLHRLTDIRNGLVETLSGECKLNVLEPDDKFAIRPGNVYVAPANYHLLIEPSQTIALSTDEKVNFSRPSIDLTFETAGIAFREKMIGIILSGANMDGARGMQQAHQNGALTIVQDPAEATVRTMPDQVLKLFNPDMILSSDEIISYINKMI